MRRITWILAMLICVTVILAGCGTKDAAGVVKDLDEVVGKLESYQGSGTMTLHTGETPQQYKVEVWYQSPSYYRISLTNAQKDVQQIVLRNDDGVFVLTPSLNKSFRFQSDWPENQGQVYLYQTLVNSILSDQSRQFTSDKDSYVFEVAANYNTHALVRQKIWLNKENYAPKQVQVSDSEANVVVEVKFDQFQFGKKFDKDSFDMERNMAVVTPDALGSMLQVDENGNPIDTDKDKSAATAEGSKQVKLGSFGVIQPTYVPDGVKFKDMSEMGKEDDYAVLLRYDGTYQYTLLEARPKDRAASLAKSTVVDLGFTVGLLSGEEQQTLTWMVDGMEYRITSADLPVSEMINIAASLQDQSGK
ncbi:outer membrane lipoprotein-sorting protein [Paenibacillus sediminis]|uniref:Outer membrane lipoprotein-sorting protein n=1 Tax=Paenibacillus sediminis TaxID=664909 RepID=A0ABS4H4E6_9BACL|nr:outer membrane lipoprotein-sorting protein [Paenibacillus sediminis]MBP1937412.1 outer membrane lipoprotein-sorting protein [Paenibacillus sediminis]